MFFNRSEPIFCSTDLSTSEEGELRNKEFTREFMAEFCRINQGHYDRLFLGSIRADRRDVWVEHCLEHLPDETGDFDAVDVVDYAEKHWDDIIDRAERHRDRGNANGTIDKNER